MQCIARFRVQQLRVAVLDETMASHRWAHSTSVMVDLGISINQSINHFIKARAGHGGAKQSTSDTGANFHLNPQLSATF